MNFKISDYIVYSEHPNKEYSRKGKSLVFSCRTGQGLIVTNYLFQKLLMGEIQEIPIEVFVKLCSYEILVPEIEDELEIIVDRKIAESLDIQTIQYFISLSELKNGFAEKKFIDHLKARKFDFVLIHLYSIKGYYLKSNELKNTIEKLSVIEKTYNWRFSFKIILDFKQFNLDTLSEFINDLDVKEFEFRIYNNDDFHKAQLEKLLYQTKGKVVTITIRLILRLLNNEMYLDILRLISSQKNDNFRILFLSDESLSKAEYADMEVSWLTKLKEFRVRGNYLPSPVLGMYVIPTIEYGQVVSDSPIELFDSDCLNVSNLVLRFFFDEDFEYLKSGEIPCSNCRVLPLCGGASKDAWIRFGEKLCPSYLKNLEQRALLVYQKGQHQNQP